VRNAECGPAQCSATGFFSRFQPPASHF
jgi:hypothetical protein